MKGLILTITAAVLLTGLTACQSPGHEGKPHYYQQETLIAVLDYPVKEIADATNEVFEDMGIVPRLSAVSNIEGVIRGHDPETKTSVKISILRKPEDVSEVKIRVGSYGDESKSVELLQGIKERLEQ